MIFDSALPLKLISFDNKKLTDFRASHPEFENERIHSIFSCLEYLENEKDARGRRLKIHKLPIPDVPVRCTKEDIIRIIGQYIPNFVHLETGKTLDAKM